MKHFFVCACCGNSFDLDQMSEEVEEVCIYCDSMQEIEYDDEDYS